MTSETDTGARPADGPAEGIHRDAWGIPHLRAGDARALARLQGLATARDRAWQLEVERHRAQGTSASFLGPEALPWDLFVRRARLDDTARRCFARLEETDPETADWIRAYADGVTEGLRTTPEFTRTALDPGRWEPWTPLGVWLATHILFAGFPAKLWREEAARRLGPDAVGLFATDGPNSSGSNGWLVSGNRTVTGHAVLAGDPHRFIEDPGVYQQIRLSCDEFDVIGLAVPGVPGIAHFGHTGTVAWAITNAMADYQDLYRERLRRTGAGVEALGPDGAWHRVARHTERVEVAGEESVEVEVLETERGPVIAGGPEGLDDGTPLALSLRYPPRVTADLGFGALLPLLRARRVADVDAALDAWAEPVNVVQAADTEGGLLHRVAGRVPVRDEANRTRLVPAWEPGHEWTGWQAAPRSGLTDGVAVMANQRGVAAELGVEFAPPHRADRIRELLAAKRRWAASDMPAIHTDTYLASAGPLLDHLAALGELSPGAAELRGRLLRWDRRMDADSEDAARFAALRGALVRRLAAHPAFAALTSPPAYPEVLLPWLALLPRIAFALEHLLRAEELYGIDRAGLVREAVEEVAEGLGAAEAVEVAGALEVSGAAGAAVAAEVAGAAGVAARELDTAGVVEAAGALEAAGAAGAAGAPDAAGGAGVAGVPDAAGVPAAVGAPESAGAPEPAGVVDAAGAPEPAGAPKPAGAPEAAGAPEPDRAPQPRWGDTHRLAAWRALPDPADEAPALSGDHDCVLCTTSVPGWTDLAARGPAARFVWDLARREDSRWVVPFGAGGRPGGPHHHDQLPLWLTGELAPVVTDWAHLTRESDDSDD